MVKYRHCCHLYYCPVPYSGGVHRYLDYYQTYDLDINSADETGLYRADSQSPLLQKLSDCRPGEMKREHYIASHCKCDLDQQAATCTDEKISLDTVF